MRRPVLLLTLSLAGLAACRDEKPPVPPSVAAAFPELPLPPNPSYVSRGGGADALTIRLRSAAPFDAVREFYLGHFKDAPWVLKNEAADPSGGTVLYAERAGRPIWVRLRRDGESHTAFGSGFDTVLKSRRKEADDFYTSIIPRSLGWSMEASRPRVCRTSRWNMSRACGWIAIAMSVG